MSRNDEPIPPADDGADDGPPDGYGPHGHPYVNVDARPGLRQGLERMTGDGCVSVLRDRTTDAAQRLVVLRKAEDGSDRYDIYDVTETTTDAAAVRAHLHDASHESVDRHGRHQTDAATDGGFFQLGDRIAMHDRRRERDEFVLGALAHQGDDAQETAEYLLQTQPGHEH